MCHYVDERATLDIRHGTCDAKSKSVSWRCNKHASRVVRFQTDASWLRHYSSFTFERARMEREDASYTTATDMGVRDMSLPISSRRGNFHGRTPFLLHERNTIRSPIIVKADDRYTATEVGVVVSRLAMLSFVLALALLVRDSAHDHAMIKIHWNGRLDPCCVHPSKTQDHCVNFFVPCVGSSGCLVFRKAVSLN